MKLATWNVNGLRSVATKGYQKWFNALDADVVCLQEIKVQSQQLTEELRSPKGYHSFFFSADKPGYSGVAVFSKRAPQNVIVGLNDPSFDREGRVLTLEFKDFDVINAYFPNSQRDHARLPFKLRFCNAIQEFLRCRREKGRNVILCGDINIAHREIDLKNPKSNVKNAGFLPEERAWLDQFLNQQGYRDAFRVFEQGPGHYTWWSYRPGVRERNIGWRLDHFFCNSELVPYLRACRHQTDVFGSDHCPVVLDVGKMS